MNINIIQPSQARFLLNIDNTMVGDNMYKTYNLQNNLYSLYYSLSPKSIFFDYSRIDKECIQFIYEFNNQVQCYVYYDHLGSDFIKFGLGSIKTIKHIHNKGYKIATDDANCIELPELLNTSLYDSTACQEKREGTVAVLNPMDQDIDSLLPYLYPYSKENIILINNTFNKHPQNLQSVSQQSIAKILKQKKNYLNVNNQYLVDAQYTNCNIVELDTFIKNKGIIKTTEQTNNIAYTSYQEYLQSIT